MKKLFLILCLMFFMSSVSYAADDSVQSLINAKKPLVLLVYATWADDINDVHSAFSEAQNVQGEKYNFKVLNIASEETKEYNKNYYIYPNLPYIMLYKSQGKITRLIGKDCILDSSCLKDKLDLFAN